MREAYDGNGGRILFGERLGRGGEGEVYAVAGQPGLVAKVLLPARRAGKHAKVRAMVEAPPAGAYDAVDGLPVLTWPREMLYAHPASRGEGTFLGYAMARMQPRDFVPFYQLTTAARRASLGGRPITFDRLVLLGLRLCHVVRTLHRFGYAVGDLNDRNVLVSRRLTPLLMDTDSFQVPRPGWGHHPCLVGDQLYWPPELLDVDLARHPVDRQGSDRFALGVLLFQLFMDGLRPYQARGSKVDGIETLAEKTRAGHYPWADPRPGLLEPPACAPDYHALPKPLRDAFERCFVLGHRKPGKRPSADDWYRALSEVHAAGYAQCPVKATHVFAKDARRCPWCADPNDPFEPKPERPAPRPARAQVKVVAAAVLPKRVKAATRGPPQRMMHAAAPVAPLPARTAKPAKRPTTKRAGAGRAKAKRPKPKARSAAKPKRRPAGKAWVAQARWLGVLTSALLAAWWLAP